jgi:hypothetical protein
MSSSQTERRQSTRIPVELRIELRHLGRPDDTFADITQDISAGGVFVATTVGLELGTELALEVTSGPGAPPILLRAEVVRVEEQPGLTGSRATSRTRGMALKFIDADDEQITRLLNIAKQMQREGAHAQPSAKTKKR